MIVATDRLYIGLTTEIEKHIEWLNDPEVVRYSEQRHKSHTLESQFSYLKSFREPNHFLGIRIIYIELLIGTMTVYVDEPNKIANVGIMIGDKAQWNKGYGYEAWSAVCNDLLTNGIRKIEAGCREDNEAMKYIFIKYGMFYEGYISKHFLLESGETKGMMLYGKNSDHHS